MSRTIKMRVDTKEISRMINSLNTLSSDINKLKTEIPKEIAKEGLKHLNSLYAKKPSTNDTDDINTSIQEYDGGCNIISQGKDVLYEEFGTGDVGEQSPHENKDKMSGLKGYNTGPTIRDVPKGNAWLEKKGITKGKYWVYMKDGVPTPTQGIPAGMQMFDTSNYLRSGVIKTIMKEKASDVLSKV